MCFRAGELTTQKMPAAAGRRMSAGSDHNAAAITSAAGSSLGSRTLSSALQTILANAT
jgi:hypothetical protein